MQHVQQREAPERISWARAMIFAVGFFFIAAILVGQLPGYIYLQMTAASLLSLEQGLLALAAVCLGGFFVILTIVLLFDPKPVISPSVFTGLGAILTVGGLVLAIWASLTGNQFFPHQGTDFFPLLGGRFLWFQDGAADLVMVGITILFVGAAMVFYSFLAMREMRNPDRRDYGTTPAIRIMLILSILLLIAFMLFYTYVDDNGLAQQMFPHDTVTGHAIIMTVLNCVLGLAVMLTLGAFALRLHYLMRPVRQRTMPPLYAVGALGLAQTGAICLLAWAFLYPLIAWMHTWTFLGLGDYLTLCARKVAIPASCSFSPQAGYIVDTIISGNSFLVLMAAVWAWKTKRNLVIIGGVTITAVLGLATLLIHTNPSEILVALVLAGGMIVLATIWTSVARREFSIVGENNLGCLGMWLVVGTCLFIYLAAFAFFSLPVFTNETEPNVPFIPGLNIPAPAPAGQPPTPGAADAVVMFFVMGILAAIQFYFLVRNRYKV